MQKYCQQQRFKQKKMENIRSRFSLMLLEMLQVGADYRLKI